MACCLDWHHASATLILVAPAESRTAISGSNFYLHIDGHPSSALTSHLLLGALVEQGLDDWAVVAQELVQPSCVVALQVQNCGSDEPCPPSIQRKVTHARSFQLTPRVSKAAALPLRRVRRGVRIPKTEGAGERSRDVGHGLHSETLTPHPVSQGLRSGASDQRKLGGGVFPVKLLIRTCCSCMELHESWDGVVAPRENKHYVVCIMYFVLCTMFYVLCTMHYVPCTMYYVPCTMYYVLST